jgi:hypothetical protein
MMIFINMKEIIWDKVMLLNLGTITLSFMEVESLLKIVLLIVSIIYTIIKIVYKKDFNSPLDNEIRKFFSKKDKNKLPD